VCDSHRAHEFLGSSRVALLFVGFMRQKLLMCPRSEADNWSMVGVRSCGTEKLKKRGFTLIEILLVHAQSGENRDDGNHHQKFD
jgi:hypothetical protein